MNFSRRHLRALAGVWLVLMATSAAPHLHLDSDERDHGAALFEAATTSPGAGDGVSPHTAHHEHSATRLGATQTCGVCRSNDQRNFGHALPGILLGTSVADRRSTPADSDLLPADPFARLHPPRAPPVRATC